MFDPNRQKADIQALMTKLSFPADAQEAFFDALEHIYADKVATAWFSQILAQYDKSEECNYAQMLADVSAMGKVLEVHEYTITMLMFLCMAKKLRERYAQRGIDEEIYDNTIMDLRYKLEECRLIHGINGFFSSSWFIGFFRMTRFALNRLQFEVVPLQSPRTLGNTVIPIGTKAINVHIPRTGGKLDHGEVLKSYRLAAEMFAHEFTEQPIFFICTTWLLDPWNMTVLSPKSNLAAFFNDFYITRTENYADYSQVWRLFDCNYTGNPADLPRDSSLRRAYAERIEGGEPIGWGCGIFAYRDGQILHTL